MPSSSSHDRLDSAGFSATTTQVGQRKAGRPTKSRVEQELAATQLQRDAMRDAEPEEWTNPPDPESLTTRQRNILEFIQTNTESHGYPPSVREIGEAVGLTSPSSVAHQLKALETKGFIRRNPKRSRAMEVRLPSASKTQSPSASTVADITDIGDYFPQAINVPLVGRIAAGAPILAEEQVEQVMPLPRDLVGDGTVYMLEVHGDSMVEAAICDGDYVIVHQQQTANDGDFVAALLEDEATVKELRHIDGHAWLMPHNARYNPINGDHASIMGKVVAVLRRI